jgi:hypothetical protein
VSPESFQLQLRSLLASLAVHVEAWALEEPTELLDAGEWGVSFEALCDALYEAELGVFAGEVCEIESLGEQLGSERRAWRLVHELTIDPDPGPPPASGLLTTVELRALIASLRVRDDAASLGAVERRIDDDLAAAFGALCAELASTGPSVFPGERCALRSLGSQLGFADSTWMAVPIRPLD